MKTNSNRNNIKTLSLALFAFILLSVTFVSCSKDKDNNSVQAYVRVSNAADGSASQDFYLDNSKLTASAVAYGQSSDFLSAKSGSHQASFKNSGSATVNTTFTLDLSGGRYYDVFFVDGNSYTAAAVDKSPTQSGKSRVRFINLSSALAANVDFGVSGGSKLASSLGYKVASSYYDVDPANGLALYAEGSSTALLSIPSSMQAGHVYTIYISGSNSASLAFHMITDN